MKIDARQSHTVALRAFLGWQLGTNKTEPLVCLLAGTDRQYPPLVDTPMVIVVQGRARAEGHQRTGGITKYHSLLRANKVVAGYLSLEPFVKASTSPNVSDSLTLDFT
jgi:hypothetical protein